MYMSYVYVFVFVSSVHHANSWRRNSSRSVPSSLCRLLTLSLPSLPTRLVFLVCLVFTTYLFALSSSVLERTITAVRHAIDNDQAKLENIQVKEVRYGTPKKDKCTYTYTNVHHTFFCPGCHPARTRQHEGRTEHARDVSLVSCVSCLVFLNSPIQSRHCFVLQLFCFEMKTY
jgi:hypothetical protein